MENDSPDPTFTVLSNPTFEDSLRAARLQSNLLEWSWLGIVAATLLVTGVWLFLTPSPFDDVLDAIPIHYIVATWAVALGVGLMVQFVLRFVLRRPSPGARRRWEAYTADQVTFTFDLSGITTVMPGHSRRLRWSYLTDFRDDGQILTFGRLGTNVFWLKPSVATSDERARLVAFIHDRMAAEATPGEAADSATSR